MYKREDVSWEDWRDTVSGCLLDSLGWSLGRRKGGWKHTQRYDTKQTVTEIEIERVCTKEQEQERRRPPKKVALSYPIDGKLKRDVSRFGDRIIKPQEPGGFDGDQRTGGEASESFRTRLWLAGDTVLAYGVQDFVR